MRTTPALSVVIAFVCGFSAAAVERIPSSDPQSAAVSAGTPSVEGVRDGAAPSGVDASTVILPCTPVAAYWTGPPRSEGMPAGPDLGIVNFDVRPKDARVHLDDRFVGRSRYLDGKPGYLYLAPGSYHLEVRLDGYRTVAVDLEVEAGCRYDLKHRLERINGMATEKKAENYGKGEPFNRVYTPVRLDAEEPGSRPDLSLRPDIARGDAPAAAPRRAAAVRFEVTPPGASVAIDGKFVATARELARMEGPLVVSSGSHRIEVTAPGFQPASRGIDLGEGEVLELSIDLTAEPESAR
jgi:hypothetical protein